MSGHIAIVTGGLRGLGKAMALGLLRSGRKVVAVGHIAEDIAEHCSATPAISRRPALPGARPAPAGTPATP